MMNDNFTVRVVLILVALGLAVLLITQYNKKEGFKTVPVKPDIPEDIDDADEGIDDEPEEVDTINTIKPSNEDTNESFENVTSTHASKKDKLTADDLLPKDAANSKWAQVNPSGQGDIKKQNFLTAGHHIGINTVGTNLRNPNLQIRSEPANPKMNVSPWLQSTIDHDDMRRPFELGST